MPCGIGLLGVSTIPTLLSGLQVGDEINTYFWEDTWVDEGPLCYRFPRLYHLFAMKLCPMASIVPSRGNPSSSFFFGLCRSLFNRETMEVTLLSLLGDTSIGPMSRDV